MASSQVSLPSQSNSENLDDFEMYSGSDSEVEVEIFEEENDFVEMYYWISDTLSAITHARLKESVIWLLDVASCRVTISFDDILMVSTIYALFFMDLRDLFAPKSADFGIMVVGSMCVFLFILEFVLQCWAKTTIQSWKPFKYNGYFGSLYFYMDIIAIFSVGLDIEWISSGLNMRNTFLFTGTEDPTLIQTGRVLRIIRLVRLVKIFKIIYERRKHARHLEYLHHMERLMLVEQNIDMVEKYGSSHPIHQEYKKQSRVGIELSEQTSKRVIMIVLAMLILVPILAYASIDNAYVYSITIMHKYNTLGTNSSILALIENFKNNPEILYLHLKPNFGVQIERNFNLLRETEYITLSRSTTINNIEYTSDIWYSIKSYSDSEALFGIILTIFVGAMLLIGSFVFTSDAQRLVLDPIERMTRVVESMAKDPLQPVAHFHQNESSTEYETKLLENTIDKITNLLRVGFGEAGADIISSNLRITDNSSVIDPLIPGKRIYAIFGFCTILDFEEINQHLGKEVMTFVNIIAEIVHSNVHHWDGNSNKNLGSSFVLVWRLGDEEALLALSANALVGRKHRGATNNNNNNEITASRRQSNAVENETNSNNNNANNTNNYRSMSSSISSMSGIESKQSEFPKRVKGMGLNGLTISTSQDGLATPTNANNNNVNGNTSTTNTNNGNGNGNGNTTTITASTPDGRSSNMTPSNVTPSGRSGFFKSILGGATTDVSKSYIPAVINRQISTIMSSDSNDNNNNNSISINDSGALNSLKGIGGGGDTSTITTFRTLSLQSTKEEVPQTGVQGASNGIQELIIPDDNKSLFSPVVKGNRLPTPSLDSRVNTLTRKNSNKNILKRLSSSNRLRKSSESVQQPERRRSLVDLRRVPGAEILADKALISYLKVLIEKTRSPPLSKYKGNALVPAKDGRNDYKVKLSFGLHAGWAIEGAVGSLKKVDATYLSPHVNMASRLESAAKQYNVPILFSEAFYELLSHTAQRYCRRIDVITVKGSESPIGIFTCDVREDIASTNTPAKEAFKRSKTRRSHSGLETSIGPPQRGSVGDTNQNTNQNADNNQSFENTADVFEKDVDLIQLRSHITEKFLEVFREGIRCYIQGDWKAATVSLKSADSMMSDILGTLDGDGPSRTILRVIKSYDGLPPQDWRGYRQLTSK